MIVESDYELKSSSPEDLAGVGAAHNTINVDQLISGEMDYLPNISNMPMGRDTFPIGSRINLETLRHNAIRLYWGYGDDGTRLDDFDMWESLARWLAENMPAAQQTPAELPPRPGNDRQSGSNRRYSCVLCGGGTFAFRYTIQRHLLEQHTQHKFYICIYNDCNELTYRPSKVNQHYRTHVRGGELSKSRIDSLLRLTPRTPPQRCVCCDRDVDGWDGLTNCIIEHCRDFGQLNNSIGDPSNDRDGGNHGEASGGGNNDSPGAAGAGSSGVPEQGSYNNISATALSAFGGSWNYRSTHCSSFHNNTQNIAPVKPECEISEHDTSFATQSITDNGKSKKETQSVSADSDVLHCVDQSKSSDTKRPHRNMPPKECRKCGDTASSCFNYQDGVAVLGRHNCNYDTQVQLLLPRPVGKYDKREGELYSASYDVNKKSSIRLEAEMIDPIVLYLEGCSVVGVHKCLYHFDNLSMLLSNTVSGIAKFAPGRREYLFLHQRNGTRLRHFTTPYPKRGQSAFTAIVASGEKLCLPSVPNQAGTTKRAKKEKVLDLNRADDINELSMR